MRVLFLTQLLPYPPVCGGTIKSFNILKHLCREHEVVLLSYIREEPSPEAMSVLQDMCKSVYTCTIKRSRWINLKDAFRTLLGKGSFIISRDWTDAMKQTVDSILARESIDLIYVDHLQMSQFVLGWRDCLKLLDEHNVEWKIIRRISDNDDSIFKRMFARIEWRKLRAYELRACKNFDVVITVSREDEDTLIKESNGSIRTKCVPIGVDLSEFEPVSLSRNSKMILSLATMSWPPNIDGALYFSREIFPLVKQKEPEAKLVIAGSKPPANVLALQDTDTSINVPGFVNDARSLAAGAAVFIVPLRSGSGMRVKILNAMALGLPVVSTSVGCEGIPAVDGQDILIADDPKNFAESILSLLADENLRFRIAANGRKFVEGKYSWQAILPELDEAVSKLAPLVGRRIST